MLAAVFAWLGPWGCVALESLILLGLVANAILTPRRYRAARAQLRDWKYPPPNCVCTHTIAAHTDSGCKAGAGKNNQRACACQFYCPSEDPYR